MNKKFMTFAAFLTEKNISNEAFDALTGAEQVKLHEEHTKGQEEYIAELEKQVGEKISKEEIDNLKKQMEEVNAREYKAIMKAVSEQGVQMAKMVKHLKGGEHTETAKDQINAFIEENAEKIKEMKNAGNGIIEMTTKVVGTVTTGSATNPAGIPELAGVQMAPPMNANIRGTIVDALVSRFTTNQSVYAYTETTPKEGEFGWTAEGALKPQVDLKIETRYAEPVKVAAYMKLTEEAITDIPGLQSIANDYLRRKHDIKRENGILFGTGLADDPVGATVYGHTFVAGSMALSVTSPTFMDVVNACITEIYTTQNYTDEMPYMANLVIVNPVDFYINLVAAKDLNGLPLYPMAALFNQVTIGGATIIPFIDMPAGKIFVADMSKYNITDYVPYSVRIGWVNDDFIKNQFCIVGESRLHAFVKNLDEVAFLYDDIATVKAAITAP